MIRNRRRDTEIFSLSFMDVICCGFGAVLLIFILTTGQKVDFSQQDLEDLRARVRQLEMQVTTERSEIEKLAKPVTLTEEELDSLLNQNVKDKTLLTERREQLRLLLEQFALVEEERARLLDEQKNLPTVEEQAVPIPEIDRRQYLTGVRLEGEFVLFLVRTSGSMLGETINDAVSRLGDPDFRKREAPKWQRVVKSVEWMIANLSPETYFQVLLFSDETRPLVPDRSDSWVKRSDKQGVQEVLVRLRDVVPAGAANMERAFTTVRYLSRLPDSIILLTDSLPTTSDSSPAVGEADDDARIRYFRYAQRQLPARIPVSTILYPMTGDPGGPALFWELATNTRGAMVSPSSTWPDI